MGEYNFEINSSGGLTEYETGAIRDIRVGKGMPCLIPVHSLKRIEMHYEAGSRKYSDTSSIDLGNENWKNGMPLMAFYDSAKRHIDEWRMGEGSEDHLAAACWNLMCLMETERRIRAGILPPSLDNRDSSEFICQGRKGGKSMGALVVSGFPGVGKTRFTEKAVTTTKDGSRLASILDSDSSRFSWLEDGIRHPDFPNNYIQHIKYNMDKADIILVSSHAVVRKALIDAGIEFWLVFPGIDTKEEYLKRYQDRGSDDQFVQMLDVNWRQWVGECIDQGCAPGVHLVALGAGQYLSDWLKDYPIESPEAARKRISHERLSQKGSDNMHPSRKDICNLLNNFVCTQGEPTRILQGLGISIDVAIGRLLSVDFNPDNLEQPIPEGISESDLALREALEKSYNELVKENANPSVVDWVIRANDLSEES